MTIQEAIGLAIEGGYEPKLMPFPCAKCNEQWLNDGMNKYNIYQALLNPQFWQALGKSIGWPEGGDGHKMKYRHHGFNQEKGPLITEEPSPYMSGWSWYWHQLINHLADGGTIEEYFNQLDK